MLIQTPVLLVMEHRSMILQLMTCNAKAQRLALLIVNIQHGTLIIVHQVNGQEYNVLGIDFLCVTTNNFPILYFVNSWKLQNAM